MSISFMSLGDTHFLFGAGPLCSHKAMTNSSSDFRVYKPANFYVHRRYKVQDVLGKGSYGVVCLVIDTKAKSLLPVQLAVKKVCKIFQKDVLLRRAIRELKLMRHFRGHRNVSDNWRSNCPILTTDCVFG